MEIYEDIGYGAEDIIRMQRNEDMVAVVFRYPDSITISDVRNGRLPDDWDGRVYVPTWDNVIALFSRLGDGATVEPGKQGEFALERLFFRSEVERAFILGYPEEGKCRIKKTRYAALRANGGSDWVYRQFLEAKLSIFEHFQGNGRTHNGVLDPDDLQSEAGLLEFVGPNRKIKDLPEVAVIHLGRLVIESRFGAGPPGDLSLAAAARPNGCSGIAVVAEGTYLVVKDYKVPRDSDPWIRILSASPDAGAGYRPIAVADWKDDGVPPSDLEACCEIPGRPGEFLLSESGFFEGRFRRVFHIRLDQRQGVWTATVLRVLKDVLPRPDAGMGKTEPGIEVKGIACLRTAAGRLILILVLGHRGGKVGQQTRTAAIAWGTLDLDAGTFQRLGETSLTPDNALGDRGCADLLPGPRESYGRPLPQCHAREQSPPTASGPFLFPHGKGNRVSQSRE